jgi:hypothetical protein
MQSYEYFFELQKKSKKKRKIDKKMELFLGCSKLCEKKYFAVSKKRCIFAIS